MIGNTMMVSYTRYLELKSTGRVRGGDPNHTASEPTIYSYTDWNGTKWSLFVGMSSTTASTTGPDTNVGPLRRRPVNRHERRAAKALARWKSSSF